MKEGRWKDTNSDVTKTLLSPIIFIGIFHHVIIAHLAGEVVGAVHLVGFHLRYVPGVLTLDKDEDDQGQNCKEKPT